MLGTQLREKYPERVPVVFVCHKDINLEKTKYLVPSTTTVADIMVLVRSNIEIKRSEAIFVLVNSTLVENTATMSTVYEEHKDDTDGILYLHVTKENTFG